MSGRVRSLASGAGRRASTYVAIVMTSAALVSALLVGAYNYWESRDLIESTVTGQLVEVGANRAARVEGALDEVQNLAGILAVEPLMPTAITELSAAYRATDEALDETQVDELRSFYSDGISLATPPGVEPPSVDQLLPSSPTAQYLQYWYSTATPPEDRRLLDDPGDGSAYSAVHAELHPALRSLVDTLEVADVLLVDLDGTIVYTTDKRIDFATDLRDGPYRDSGIASALSRLETAAVGDVVIMDYEPYAPAGGLPTLWVATAVRTQDEVVGAVAIPFGNEALVDLVTAGREWEALGLGDTGDIYVVGPDRLLRSEARPWLEDPEEYLAAMAAAGYPDETIEAVRTFGTTVLVQPADTEAVAAALGGDEFEGTTTDPLGRRVRSYARPIDSGLLGWVAVTEIETGEVLSPLRRYVTRLALIALITIPIVIMVATVIARRMLRPIDPIIEAAGDVTGGDIDVVIGMGGKDEFSDLAAQFDAFVAELRHQRSEVARADAETDELLASVLPRRLVDQYRSGDRDIAESIRNATLVAVRAAAEPPGSIAEDETAEYGVAVAQAVADIARTHGAEQIGASASSSMYALGLGSDRLEIDEALVFASEIHRWVESYLADGEIPLRIGIGVAAGDVVANVIGTERLAFDVLGSPRRTAEQLAATASESVLVDATIAARIGDEWVIDRISGTDDPVGDGIEAWRLSARADA